MWIARDKDGYLTLFITVKPVRVENKRWNGNKHNTLTAFEDWAALPEEWFPNLKWEDEPVEVSLIETNELNVIKRRANAWVDTFDKEDEH